MSNGQQIAETILAQLGGRRFLAMTGAKNLCSHGDENALSFRLPARFASKGINHIRIDLTADDLYNVTYRKIWGTKVTTVATDEGIYADMLAALFTARTGLDTHL